MDDGSNADAGPSAASVQSQLTSLAARKETLQTQRGNTDTVASASKLAKNKRLPATMITPAGNIEASKKNKKEGGGKKKKARSEKGKEKALERMEMMQARVKQSEDKKAKRQRAKKAWE